MSSPPPGPWVTRWLSVPRHGAYLAAAGHDQQRALDLYEWNTGTSMALMHDLAHLEVGLRNAYDRALQRGAPAGQHWTADPAKLFPVAMATARNGRRFDRNKKSREQLEKAAQDALADVRQAAKAAYNDRRRQLPAGTVAPAYIEPTAPPPGKVVAEVMFGFWRYLTIAAHEKTVWVPYLNIVYPAGTNRADVDKLVERVYRVRNRVAHHEPLLRRDPATGILSTSTAPAEARYADLLRLAGLLDPDLRDYIAAKSTLPQWFRSQS
jgi:hypothetical protein